MESTGAYSSHRDEQPPWILQSVRSLRSLTMAWDSDALFYISPKVHREVSPDTLSALTIAGGLQRWRVGAMPYCSTSNR